MAILKEGQKIGGTYEVETFLGEGAFAEVYRVKHRFLGRQAMKVFKSVGMTIEEIESALSEAVLLSRIGHPNIVRVFDANLLDSPNGACGYFTMEYVAGGSLDSLWQSFGNRFMPIDTVMEIAKQLCRGLDVAHGTTPPIVHRDIKPQNVLVGYDANGLRVRISDFGLAKSVNPRTLMASARGTRCFKAPEALRDFQRDSLAGDIWALGSTLYLLLTDRLPYAEGMTAAGEGLARFDKPLIPPSRLNIQVPIGLEAVVLKALALVPEHRYQSAREVLQDLDRCATGTELENSWEQHSSTSKEILGEHSPMDQDSAQKMAKRAIHLAKDGGKLNEAADLMEEAFNKWPDLRTSYEYQVKLWRRGMAM
jgi:eukaryotic-like serine/threonine-protein kinase